MNVGEKIQWPSEKGETNPQLMEEVFPREVNLTSASALIERLEAVDEPTYTDKEEAIAMLDWLEKQKQHMEAEKLPIPKTLNFAISELRVFAEGKTRTIREVYADKEAEPESPARILAEAGELELRLVEQGAAGTLASHKDVLRSQIAEVLPKLELLTSASDAETRSIAESYRATLKRFSEES